MFKICQQNTCICNSRLPSWKWQARWKSEQNQHWINVIWFMERMTSRSRRTKSYPTLQIHEICHRNKHNDMLLTPEQNNLVHAFTANFALTFTLLVKSKMAAYCWNTSALLAYFKHCACNLHPILLLSRRHVNLQGPHCASIRKLVWITKMHRNQDIRIMWNREIMITFWWNISCYQLSVFNNGHYLYLLRIYNHLWMILNH